jgi:hypothetical protein
MMIITQTANQISVQLGSEKESYTLDDKPTVTPAGDLNALKTWAHWDGAKLHLHFKKGMNWGRDILSLNDGWWRIHHLYPYIFKALTGLPCETHGG